MAERMLKMLRKLVFHSVKYDRPGKCSPEKDCLR